MKTILVNFSHPLSAEAKKILEEKYNVTDFIDIGVHLDTSQDVEPQVEGIIENVREAVYGEDIDYIILPGFSVAAALVSWAFPDAKIVRLAAKGTPPVWVPVEII